jgi:hypothetical protein
MGSEGCVCYGNDTCNAPLTCLSKLCVNASASGNGGAPATGGATGNGGAPSTGGTTGSGGAVSSGGATGSGGSPGSGGAPATGGTTGSGGTPSTGGTTGSGGSPSTGGTPGSGGSPSTGGVTGGAGAGGAPGGPLQFTSGWVASTSNAYGIQGAIYTFGDMAGSTISPDCSTSTSTCFGATTTPTTKFCVSGTDTEVLYSTSLGDYDYATYWGAAVGFDLNGSATAGVAHQPYAASAHHVVGFSMSFTNNTSSAVRFSYLVYNGTSNVAYCVSQLSPGQNTVYFTNATANCYQTGGTALSNAAADGTVALQWQVPSSANGSISFNYCVDNLTPLTQ